jgi:phosphatidylethanolamine/phosphatidyl-N-methylethanolamine N-methyltransferase
VAARLDGRGIPTALDQDAVRRAYRVQASFYDRTFGRVSTSARLVTVEAVNALPGREVLEVGVGTGLALPHYSPLKHVTGIDLSAEMLERARDRVVAGQLSHVGPLLERDAESTGLPTASFDIAACMFVASVVVHPRALLAELRRLVRPGGHILFVNHFAAERGPRWWLENAMAPLSHALGWHPHFQLADLFEAADLEGATRLDLPPFGIFSLITLKL